MKVKEFMKKNPVTSLQTPLSRRLKDWAREEDRFVSCVGERETGWYCERIDIVRFLTVLRGKGGRIRITIEGLGGKLSDLRKLFLSWNQHNTIVLSMISLPRTEKKEWMIVLRLKTSSPDQL